MHWRDRSRRRPAINEPGHAHELTFTCFRNLAFLKAERSCLWLAESLEEARTTLDFALWAYVFMPDHVHLLVWPRQQEYDVSEIRKRIKEPVARKAIAYLQREAPHWLARITVRRGRRTECRFWQSGGGFDRNVTEARTLSHMVEYIHNNPVRKNLAARPEDWKWSSAGWLTDQEPNTLRPDPIPPEWGVVEYPATERR